MLSAIVLYSCTALHSQATAGYVPPGTSINFTPVELSVIERYQDTITYLDLDGDGMDDVRIRLVKGYPPLDWTNEVIFFALDNSFSLCNETWFTEHVVYYQQGDTLCTNNEYWKTDSIYTVGCFGGWGCVQDESPVIDQFVAYKWNSTGEIGWIKVSMSLGSETDSIPVTFTISEMLVLYTGTGINDTKETDIFDVIPNPTSDGRFEIQHVNTFSDIEIFNPIGQCIERKKWNENQFQLPDHKGLYVIRLIDTNGKYSIRKILRL